MSMGSGDKGLLGLPTFHPESSKAALIGIGSPGFNSLTSIPLDNKYEFNL